MHVYPAFRQLARHGAVLPPVAPKKATLLGEDMMLITLFGVSFDGFQPWGWRGGGKARIIYKMKNVVINFQITDFSVASLGVKYIS